MTPLLIPAGQKDYCRPRIVDRLVVVHALPPIHHSALLAICNTLSNCQNVYADTASMHVPISARQQLPAFQCNSADGAYGCWHVCFSAIQHSIIGIASQHHSYMFGLCTLIS